VTWGRAYGGKFIQLRKLTEMFYLYFFMAGTQWTTLGRLLKDFKKNFSQLRYSKSKDFICNSTKPFAVAATN